MGKQWKKEDKLSTSNKKSQLFTKIAREIQVASRAGVDPDSNSRLKVALGWARSQSMPSKTIQRALEKNTKNQLEEVLYEGFGPFGVAFLISCYTDNKVRTVAEVRNLFKKCGGNMLGSTRWMFDKIGQILAQKLGSKDVIEEALEVGASDLELGPKGVTCFYCDLKDILTVSMNLEKNKWNILSCHIYYKAKQIQNLTTEQAEEVHQFAELLENQQDCQQVYSNVSKK